MPPVLGVVQHRVPVREGAALGVLAGEPHRRAIHQQRREGERLGVAPVDPAFSLQRVVTTLQLLRRVAGAA